MEIRAVETQADLRQFIQLPYRLYRGDRNWVAPLRSEQWAQFDAARNPMLDHCEYALFLLWDAGRPVGRISAFVDSLALEAWGEPIGLFGSFECCQSPEGARLLLDAARVWLRERGMARMRGPWSFASQEWGVVVEGFSPPVILAPHNPTWYNDLLSGYGLEKAKDLLVYEIRCGNDYAIPERYRTVTGRLQQRNGITVRRIDMALLADEVDTLMDLGNRSLAHNWGFYPVTPAESAALARDLKRLVDPAAVLIAEDAHGEPIGFVIALPDINVLLRGLNGRLFPMGWLKLLTGLSKIRDYRIWALGVLPEHHLRGVDALLYRELFDALGPKGARIEINYILEDNAPMNNAVRSLGATPLRRYRVYETAV